MIYKRKTRSFMNTEKVTYHWEETKMISHVKPFAKNSY